MVLEEFIQKISKITLEQLFGVLGKLLAIVVVFFLAGVVLNIVTHFTSKGLKKAAEMDDQKKSSQYKTTMTISHSVYRYGIYAVAVVIAADIIGFGDQLSGAVVAAGIGGLAISFGAQSIIKDMVAGLFMMFEKQYFVGDIVKIAGYEGRVESIALRVTYLDCKGKRVIVPNGQISDVVNYSRSNNVASLIIPTPYEENTDNIIKILEEIIEKFTKEYPELVADKKGEVLGIANFGDSSVDIELRVYVKPMEQWRAERALRLMIKKEFDQKNISIPYQQIEVRNKKTG